ncbi:MAG: hypothetical protein GVY26_11050 [Bacteroidetes bacterium]|jgi:hypothetical protein|nr:hypothetical protein [Bacteroidota bacterium]
MSVAQMKNDLHRMVVETDDPDVLIQMKAFFASVLGDQDWWDSISEEEKQLIELGQSDADEGRKTSFEVIRKKVEQRLEQNKRS